MNKVNIDGLDILRVDEFQDYQVEDVVVFAVLFPDWKDYKDGMLKFIESYNRDILTGYPMFRDDFSLLEYSYHFAQTKELPNIRRCEDAN